MNLAQRERYVEIECVWILRTDFICAQIQILALGAQLASAVQTIDIKGSDFFNSATGDRFQLLGVAYQPGGAAGYDPASGIDPLSDGDVCLRDAALMQQLGAHIHISSMERSRARQ
jgi:hypothetical protein